MSDLELFFCQCLGSAFSFFSRVLQYLWFVIWGEVGVGAAEVVQMRRYFLHLLSQ